MVRRDVRAGHFATGRGKGEYLLGGARNLEKQLIQEFNKSAYWEIRNAFWYFDNGKHYILTFGVFLVYKVLLKEINARKST